MRKVYTRPVFRVISMDANEQRIVIIVIPSYVELPWFFREEAMVFPRQNFFISYVKLKSP